MPRAELGEFLMTRRAKVTPEDVGMPAAGERRVPGLRRDEVAALAGVSVDYYRRLEQGKETRPSEVVLAGLSKALRMTEAEERHLYALAGAAHRLGEEATVQPVPNELLDLMDSWRDSGAMVLDPVLDVVAMNAEAQELFSGFEETANLLEMVFLDPEGRRFFVEWDASAEASVANLRASADFAETPARLRELLDRLNAESPEFPALWARHDVRPKTHETKVLRHPERGLLNIEFHAFNVASVPGYQLLVYREQGPAADSADR
ncbi:helix-turn-helix transcriptional regulator [Streptomonospora sp. S1-112]|uniref:Helix-turn-helix transcriptional regulator n=1 Tax=Streptomonospora mangrovi TaxID=2883123 RepID=A0A9X3NJ45_9ACTN|nr:helix-turn-helix transcriptional regulator [Streptomonospora mangrovi]MDA0564188.1 helix-turn-helix transcriptional regulator [Streptomonospora mangrovi]